MFIIEGESGCDSLTSGSEIGWKTVAMQMKSPRAKNLSLEIYFLFSVLRNRWPCTRHFYVFSKLLNQQSGVPGFIFHWRRCWSLKNAGQGLLEGAHLWRCFGNVLSLLVSCQITLAMEYLLCGIHITWVGPVRQWQVLLSPTVLWRRKLPSDIVIPCHAPGTVPILFHWVLTSTLTACQDYYCPCFTGEL